ncbi:MAG TPA: hypothetical protein PLX69_22730, partial [Leptospiraceae bacterium]|nr:hypothetical protein [Leptospiraceae bacterium]HRG77393.1 hypothetical protein [Leptospiraceae bacterium]
ASQFVIEGFSNIGQCFQLNGRIGIPQCCQVKDTEYDSHLEQPHRERSILLNTIVLLHDRFLTFVRNDCKIP